jgi:serine protease Do
MLAAAFVLGGGAWAAQASASELRRSAIVRAVERASPAVVNVSTEQKGVGPRGPFPDLPRGSLFDEFFRDFLSPFPRYRERANLGSGVIVDPKGFILTNEHVVQDASAIRVVLSDQREFPAQLVGADPPSDLAVLRIESRETLPVIPMGRSDDLMIGETVVAIGNALGLSHTVTTGVISALNRSVRTEPRVYRDFIQTDAAINPGNSGGPLLNIDGELIGINTAIYQKAQGVGFAIPIDRARRIFQEIIQYGEVKPAWIGAEVQSLDEPLARSFGAEGRRGVLVTHVAPGGPAAKAGLRKGDLLTAVGQGMVLSREDFQEALAGYTAHSTIEVTFLREGKQRSVQVKAEPPNPKEIMRSAEERLGMIVEAVTPARRREFDLARDGGAVVTEVQPQGLADRARIRPGDLIRQVNEQEIRGLEDYEKAIARALRHTTLRLVIQRRSYGYSVTLDLGGM